MGALAMVGASCQCGDHAKPVLVIDWSKRADFWQCGVSVGARYDGGAGWAKRASVIQSSRICKDSTMHISYLIE